METQGRKAADDGTSSLAASNMDPPMSAPPSRADLEFPDDPFAAPQRHRRHVQGSSSQEPQSHHHRQQQQQESLSDWAKNTRFTVLNHFSHVTNVARNGAHTLMSSPLFRPPSPEDVRRGAKGSQRQSAGAALGTSLQQHGPVGPFGPSDPDWKHSELAQKSGTADFDSAHVYLARWAKIVAEEGENNRRKEQEILAQSSATSPSAAAVDRQGGAAIRASDRPSSLGSKLPMEHSDVGSFEVWNRTPWSDLPETTRIKNYPLTQSEWKSCFYADGKPVLSWTDIKAKIFERGLVNDLVDDDDEGTGSLHWDEMSARAEAWSFLLGIQQWSRHSNRFARRQAWRQKADEYWSTKAFWSQLSEKSSDIARDTTGIDRQDQDYLREERHRIRVDCLRVDKKLPFFSRARDSVQVGAAYPSDNVHIRRLEDILLTFACWDRDHEDGRGNISAEERGQLGGYVQGMSDLCAPLYALCGSDEAKTFWLFVGLMKRTRRNFYADQSGMKMQLLALQKLIVALDPGLHAHLENLDALNLFFCFRWLLVCFKREFEYPDILRLWEGIWAAAFDDSEDDWEQSSVDHHAQSDDPLTAAAEQKALREHRDNLAASQPAPSKSATSLSDNFQIFVAFAVLEQQRDVVVKYLKHFDEILQYMNGLSGQLDVDTTLAEAQVACLSLRNLIALQRGESLLGNAENDVQQSKIATSDTDKALRNKEVERQQAAAALPPVDAELCALVGESAP